MKYNFQIIATTGKYLFAQSEEIAEIIAGAMSSKLIEGTPLEEEYPETRYHLHLVETGIAFYSAYGHYGHRIEMNRYAVTIECFFDYEIEATSMVSLISHDNEIQTLCSDTIRALFDDSKLDLEKIKLDINLSDVQPALADLLSGMWGNYNSFCIQHECSLYHPVCAREAFGDEAVDYVEEFGYNDDNGMSSTTCDAYAHEYENNFMRREEYCDTCECGNSLFDVPKR